jgi:hypothetical protein
MGKIEKLLKTLAQEVEPSQAKKSPRGWNDTELQEVTNAWMTLKKYKTSRTKIVGHLLQRPNGVSDAEIKYMFGWKPHHVRRCARFHNLRFVTVIEDGKKHYFGKL